MIVTLVTVSTEDLCLKIHYSIGNITSRFPSTVHRGHLVMIERATLQGHIALFPRLISVTS